ncbi:MAG: O-antigen ligase family protein [Anaerolineaceae bacterium]|nr:O-antigen ligase family protein [Anaerolineaceae bacterium]
MNVDRKMLQDYLKISGVVAIMVYLLFYAGTKFNLIDLNALTKTTIILALLWIATLTFGKMRNTALDLPAAFAIGVMLFTSILGDLPRQAFVEVGYIFIAILIFIFVVVLMQRGWDPKIISKSILIIGGVFMILAWMEFLAWYFGWLRLDTGKIIPPFSYRLPSPNFICVMMNVWILFALGHLFYVKEKFPRILLSAYILSGLGIIYLTSSRGGWIGLAGGLLFFAFFYVYKKQFGKLKLSLNKLKQPKYWIPIVILIAIMIIVVAMLLLRTEAHPTHGPIFQSRNILWGPAFKAITGSPIIGHGPYAYIYYYLSGNSVPPGQLFDYAHNIYFDALVSSGIIGLAALLWIIIAGVKQLLKLLQDSESYLFYLGLGIIGSFSAFLIHGLFDSVHHTVPVSLWNICILLAIPVGLVSRNNQKRNYLPLLLGILLFPAMIWYIYAGSPFEKAVYSAENNQLLQAIDLMQIAEQRDPALPLIPQQMGILYAQLAEESGNKSYLEDAKTAFEKAIEQDQSWAATYLNLGVIYDALGENTLAETSLRKSVELAPRGVLFYWNLGIFYEEHERYAEAAKAYESCIALDQRIIFSNTWKASQFRNELADTWKSDNSDITKAFDEQLSETTNTMLAIQYPEHAKKDSLTLYYLVKASKQFRENNLDRAQKFLDMGQLAYLNFTESNVQTVWLWAEIDAANGEYENAITTGELAITAVLQPGLYGPGSYGQHIYGANVYRRQELPDYFIPQINEMPITLEWVQRIQKISEWYEETGNNEKQQYWLEIENALSE